jgi:hypothetical protein
VRFRETCLAVVVVVARVRDEVLYTFFTAPSTPLHSCPTLVLANVRRAPRPLCCPLAGTLLLAAAWPLVGIREDPVEDPRFRHWGSLHRFLAPLRCSSSSPSSLPSRRHARGSSCGTISRSGSPRSWVCGVVRSLAPHRRSSSSLSPCLLSRLLCA